MLELVNSRASIFTLPSAAQRKRHGGERPGDLVVGLAQSDRELDAIGRLRYNVFSSEYGASLNQSGLDRDTFDVWCDHLMVKDLLSDEVVGTYRILTPHQAKRAGGYYSEQEFDLSGLGIVKGQLVEFGRACIHEQYRNGAVLMMLWSGLAEILKQGRYEHVFGCASVSLRDDGVSAAQVWRSVREHLGGADEEPVVVPHHRYPVEQIDDDLPGVIPALLSGYLKLGARVCGQPAWDPDFNTADFPMLLSVSQMGVRYRKHFGFE